MLERFSEKEFGSETTLEVYDLKNTGELFSSILCYGPALQLQVFIFMPKRKYVLSRISSIYIYINVKLEHVQFYSCAECASTDQN